MNYINMNSVLLGIFFAITVIFYNIIYSILCRIFKIKIVDFVIFLSVKFSIHKDNIGNVNYTLGWLPIGAQITPLGMYIDDENKIIESDLDFAYYKKSIYTRVFLSLYSQIFYLILFVVAIQFFIKDYNDYQAVGEYIRDVTVNIFSIKYDKNQLINETRDFIRNKNILTFEILVFLLVLIIVSLINKLFSFLCDFNNKSKPKIIGSILFLVIISYFIYWKIPSFFLSFFSTRENIVFILNFMLSAFICGFFLYFFIIIILKSTPEKHLMYGEVKGEGNFMNNLDYNNLFEKLNLINSKVFINNTAVTELLKNIREYLQLELQNKETRYSKNEFEFYNKINSLLSNKNYGIEKYLPFLVTSTEKRNKEFLKDILLLFNKRNEIIESYYEKDILVVDEFLAYTKQKLIDREFFYYDNDYKEALWTKSEFGNIMYNYLVFKIRLDPNCLDINYLIYMRAHFTFCRLSIDDKLKTQKANDYFSKTIDPFSYDIPPEYNDVRTEINYSTVSMIQSERFFDKISNLVLDKYKE